MQTWRTAKTNVLRKYLITSFLQNTSSDCLCKMMKFYEDICYLFVLTDLGHVPRSIEMYFYRYFPTDMLVNFFIPFRRVEAITWEILSQQSGIPAVQKRDPILPGWNFLHEIVGYNLWRIYNTARILVE